MGVKNPFIEANPESPLFNLKTQKSMLESPNGKGLKSHNDFTSSNTKQRLSKTKATSGNFRS